MQCRRLTAFVVTLGLCLTITGALTAPASAVTYGTAITAPARTVPWVVSLFHSSNADASDPRFLCTASALSSREVLTAAHCVQRAGFYFVAVGANRLTEGRLVAVEAIVDHSGYRERSSSNDVATVRTLRPLGLKTYARIGSAALARRVNGARPPALTLYGWGQTQTGRITKQLLSAELDPQAPAARTTYGPLFRPALMLAAGRYDKDTNTYRGACYGDSGGPLVVTVDRVPYVVGVTSFGAPGCRKKAPTIFTSVGAYTGWLTTARQALPREASQNNLAFPEVLTDPAVAGTVALGRTLTCNIGRWTSNARGATVTWHHEDDNQIGTGRTYVVSAADAGRRIYCEVEMASQAGSSVHPSTSVAAVPAPFTTAAPRITGLPDGSPPAVGVVATCVGPTYRQPGVTSVYSWSATDPGGAATSLATGPSLTMTDEVLRAVGGRQLGCSVRTTNAMGAHVVATAVSLPAAQ